MAFKVGSFAKTDNTTVPVTQSVTHNLGQTPKGMIMFFTRSAQDTIAQSEAAFGIGFVDSARDGYTVVGNVFNGQAPSAGNQSRALRAVPLSMLGGAGTVISAATISAWSSTTFTVNWTVNDASTFIVNYIIFGGSGVDTQIVDYLAPNSTGNKSVTGAGFTPTGMLQLGSGSIVGTLPIDDPDNNSYTTFGATDGTNQWGELAFGTNQAGPVSDMRRQQETDRFNTDFNGTIVAFTSDGATINLGTAPSANNSHIFFYFLKGITVAVGSKVKSNSISVPVTDSVTGLSFTPQAVLLSSVMNTVAAGQVTNRMALGFGLSDGTNERTGGVGAQDNVNPHKGYTWQHTGKAFQKVNNDTPAVDAEADLALTADGFDLTWTTNDAVLTQLVYVAMGGTSGAAAGGGGGQGGGHGGGNGGGGGGGGGNPGGGPPGQGGGNGKPDRFFVANRRERRLVDF
jgi:hypothetical protein